jgi:hypothetical protein
MGYYVISNLINRKDNMSKETMKQTINTIQSIDGMKAVKVAFDLSQTNMDSITKVTEVISLVDKNLKSLAIKVMELEKKLEAYETKGWRYEPRKN